MMNINIKKGEMVEVNINGRKEIVKFAGLTRSRMYKGYFNYLTNNDNLVHQTKIENIVRTF